MVNKKGEIHHRRRASFNTAAIAMNCMPEKVNFGDSVINLFLVFEEAHACPSEEDLVPIVENLLLYHHRMNSIPTGEKGKKNWSFEPSQIPIDPKAMIRTIQLDSDSIDGMNDAMQCEASKTLQSVERKLPWWEFVILSNKGKGESVIILRIDHTIGDGFSIGNMCCNFLTHRDGTSLKDFIPESMKSGKKKTSFGYFSFIWKAVFAAVTVASMPLFMKVDHKTLFSKNVVGPEVVDTRKQKIFIFDPIPLEFVRAIKNAAKCSLNDVLMSCLSQAIYDYCKQRKCPILEKYGENTLCRCSIAFGFPSDELHNGWVPLTVDLGLGKESSRDRLNYISQITRNLKQSLIPHFQAIMQNDVTPFLPVSHYRKLVHKFFTSHSANFTSMPGPQEEVLFAGKPVSRCWFTARHLGPLFSFLSYNGEIYAALVADDEAITDVHLMPDYYMRALWKFGDEYGVAVPKRIKDSANKNQ